MVREPESKPGRNRCLVLVDQRLQRAILAEAREAASRRRSAVARRRRRKARRLVAWSGDWS
jgi:hypothetical protein